MAKTIRNSKAVNIDEYIAGFPTDIQKKLEEIRATIKKAVPQAKEAIKYDIPTFTLNGNLVSFGAWKKHIGLYPAPRTAEEFKKELSAYEGEKSTVKFPLDHPLPLPLIGKIINYNVKRHLEKAGTKGQKKK
ncbi:MAG: DUF1801 domain-containing protein [Ginsengibacter sp.]